MTAKTRNGLKAAILEWANATGHCVRPYKSCFGCGTPCLSIETSDSAKTLHQIASYLDRNGTPSYIVDALFDKRYEGRTCNIRIIYWPDIPAAAAAKENA